MANQTGKHTGECYVYCLCCRCMLTNFGLIPCEQQAVDTAVTMQDCMINAGAVIKDPRILDVYCEKEEE